MDNVGFLAAPGFFLLCARALAPVPPPLSGEYLEKAFNSGKLQFFASLESLRDRARSSPNWLAQAKQIDWVVYAKRPFAGPAAGA